MPFRSVRQERYLWAKHPEIAARWEKEYGSRPENAEALRDARKKAARK